MQITVPSNLTPYQQAREHLDWEVARGRSYAQIMHSLGHEDRLGHVTEDRALQALVRVALNFTQNNSEAA